MNALPGIDMNLAQAARFALRRLLVMLLALVVYVGSSGILQRDICDPGLVDYGPQFVHFETDDHVMISVSRRWAAPVATMYAPLGWLAEYTWLGGPLQAYWQGVLDVYYAISLPDPATPYRTHGGVI